MAPLPPFEVEKVGQPKGPRTRYIYSGVADLATIYIVDGCLRNLGDISTSRNLLLKHLCGGAHTIV